MIYTGYTENDNYYEFDGENIKEIMPKTAVILVDDESDLLSIKLTASRKTIGLVPKN